jgi:isopenicillin-N epimerase
VPSAIQFQTAHNWPHVQTRCQQILAEFLPEIGTFTGQESIYSPKEASYIQMAAIRLPLLRDLEGFQAKLYQKFRIEVPCIKWNNEHFLRISIQAYNSSEDLEALVVALKQLLPAFQL